MPETLESLVTDSVGVAVLAQRVTHIERSLEKIETRHNQLIMLMLGTLGSTVLTLLVVLYEVGAQ